MNSRDRSRVTFGTFSRPAAKTESADAEIYLNGEHVGWIEKDVAVVEEGLRTCEDRLAVCSYTVILFDRDEQETFDLHYNRHGELKPSSMTWRQALAAAKDYARRELLGGDR